MRSAGWHGLFNVEQSAVSGPMLVSCLRRKQYEDVNDAQRLSQVRRSLMIRSEKIWERVVSEKAWTASFMDYAVCGAR